MANQGFDLLEYGKSIERLMEQWHSHTRVVLRQSSDLGSAREHFVKGILENVLPKSVIVGSGEIVDGLGARSPQQDVIIYRSDFPVIASLAPVNTYLAEGVIATVEVKSDLSTGEPNQLSVAFKNIKGVLALKKGTFTIRGQPDQVDLLKNVSQIRTYVVGYAGWKTDKTFLENVVKAIVQAGGDMPHLICQPGCCITRNDGFLNPGLAEEKTGLLLQNENPYAVLLHHLLKAVMFNTSGLILTAPGIDAMLVYYLDHYFNFVPPLAFQRIKLQPVD
jgi:hypothetical protein